MKKIIILVLALVSEYSYAQRVNHTNIEMVVSYLASDALNGRATGSVEEKIAAKFIADKFKMLQLKPYGSNWYYYDFAQKYSMDIHDTTGK